MLLFCISNNIIYNLIGYELIGLISYFLINYYNSRLISNKCSLYSILIGKLGDIGILLSIYEYYNILLSYSICGISLGIWIVLYVTLGVISKSAQYFLLS